MRERSALQERPSAGLVSFVARLFAAAGVGIAAMGALIPLPILCYSHGPSACGLAPPLLTIPHLLDAIGVGLGSAGAVMIVALRLRRPRGPTYGSD